MLLKKKVVATKIKHSSSQSFKNPALTKKNLNQFLKETDRESSYNLSTTSLPLTQYKQQSLSGTQSRHSSKSIVNVNISFDLQKDIQESPACSQTTLSSQQLNEKKSKQSCLKLFPNENKKCDDTGDTLNTLEKKTLKRNTSEKINSLEGKSLTKNVLMKKVDSFRSESVISKSQSSPALIKKQKKTEVEKENIEPDSGMVLSQEFLNDPEIKKMYGEFVKNKLSQEKSFTPQEKPKNKKHSEKKTTTKNLNKEKEDINQNEVPTKKRIIENGKHTQIKKTKKSKHGKMILTKRSSTVLSYSYREKLIADLELRDVGLYVFCDRCDKTRYLPHVKDPLELPDLWYCYMNRDKYYNTCEAPNFELPPEEDEKTILNLYNAGSVVWAKMDGYPWWPAMVDDDPDTEDYYWLEGDSDVPTWYHVTFFDNEVSRAWMRPSQLAPFKTNMLGQLSKVNPKYKHRLEIAMKEAKNANDLPLLDRLKKYSFIVRYNKPIKKPKVVEVKMKKHKIKVNDKKGKKRRIMRIRSSESLGNKNYINDSFEDITAEIDERISWFDKVSDCDDLELFNNFSLKL